jgi:hypothetical protein
MAIVTTRANALDTTVNLTQAGVPSRYDWGELMAGHRVGAFLWDVPPPCQPKMASIPIDALYGAAKIMMPEIDWSWLRTAKTRLYAAAGPKGPSGPVITSVQLVDLGQQLMTETEITPGSLVKMADAIRYRDGLMIALLGFIPLRHRNFAAIEIGRELVKVGEHWFITISPEDTETKVAMDFQVPELLQPHLATYLNHARPRMLRQPTCRALWVSSKEGMLSYSAVGGVRQTR